MEYNIAASDISRLVLGYLKCECKSAYKAFLKYNFKGKYIRTRVAGQSLVDILKVHARVYDIIQERLEHTNYFKERSSEHTSPVYLPDQLLYILDKDNKYSDSCVSSPYPRSTEASPEPEEEPSVNANASDVETTPEDALPGNIRYGSEDSYFYKTPRRKQSKANKPTTIENMPAPDKEVVSELMTQRLIQNEKLVEKIAKNINSVLSTPEIAAKIVEDDKIRKGVSAELDATIKTVLRKTEEDPMFEDLLQDIIGAHDVDNISKAMDMNGASTSTQNLYQHMYEAPRQRYQMSDTHTGQTSQSLCSAGVASSDKKDPTKNLLTPIDTPTSNEVIVFDGTLDNYLKTNTCNVDTQTPVVPNPIYINTNAGLMMVPPNATNIQYNTTQQYYLVNPQQSVTSQNQSIVIPQSNTQPVGVPQVSSNLTQSDIMAMSTVIVSDKGQNIKQDFKASKNQTKMILPKPTNDLTINLEEFITINPNETESKPQPKRVGLKKVIYPKRKRAPDNMKDQQAAQTSSATSDSVEPEAETKKVLKESTKDGPKSVPFIKTPSSTITKKKSTPKSGSHVRSLDFSTPPKLTSTNKKCSKEKSPTFIHKKQAAKTLFKSSIENDNTEDKKPETMNKPNSDLRSWDGELRKLIGSTDERNIEKKNLTPKRKKKTALKVKKRTKSNLNNTDHEAMLLEAALKTPDKSNNDISKEDIPTESKCTLASENNTETGGETTNKKILSPSKLFAGKNIQKNETNVTSSPNEITPEMSNGKCNKPITKARNLAAVLMQTPLKPEIIPKTPGIITPGNNISGIFSPNASITKLLEVNLSKGVASDITSIDTPDFAITPGFSISHIDATTPFASRGTDYSGASSYYQPTSDNEHNRSVEIEEALIKETRRLESCVTPDKTQITVISDVLVKSASEQEKTYGIRVDEHLRAFNENVIGKKNLSLIKVNACLSPSDSSSEESNEESNKTVICNKELKIQNEKASYSYSLRTRKPSASATVEVAQKKIKDDSKCSPKENVRKSPKKAFKGKTKENKILCQRSKSKETSIDPLGKSKNVKNNGEKMLNENKPKEATKGKPRQNSAKRKSQEMHPVKKSTELSSKESTESRIDKPSEQVKTSAEDENSADNKNEDVDLNREIPILNGEDQKEDTAKSKIKEKSEEKSSESLNKSEDMKPSTADKNGNVDTNKETTKSNEIESRPDPENIIQILSTVEVKDTFKKKIELPSYHETVLKEMEEKRTRTINLFKHDDADAKPKNKRDPRKAQPAKEKTQTGVNNARKSKRKSDSPKKISNNAIYKRSKSIKDQIVHDFMPELSSDEEEIVEEQKTNEKSDKSSSDLEAQSLIEGLKERGIHLMHNKTPKKNKDLPQVDSKESLNEKPNVFEEKKMVARSDSTTPADQDVLNDSTEPTGQDMLETKSNASEDCEMREVRVYEQEDEHIIFDPTKKPTKTFEDYNLAALDKSFNCALEFEEGPVNVRVKCSSFQTLFDVPSTVINVLIPRRKAVVSASKSESIAAKRRKSKDTVRQSVSESDKNEQGKTEEQETIGIDVDKERFEEPMDKEHDSLMNFAIVCTSEREKNEENRMKKRKHRTDSTSSNSLHADKKSKNEPDTILLKGVDVDSFLNKIHGD